MSKGPPPLSVLPLEYAAPASADLSPFVRHLGYAMIAWAAAVILSGLAVLDYVSLGFLFRGRLGSVDFWSSISSAVQLLLLPPVALATGLTAWYADRNRSAQSALFVLIVLTLALIAANGLCQLLFWIQYRGLLSAIFGRPLAWIALNALICALVPVIVLRVLSGRADPSRQPRDAARGVARVFLILYAVCLIFNSLSVDTGLVWLVNTLLEMPYLKYPTDARAAPPDWFEWYGRIVCITAGVLIGIACWSGSWRWMRRSVGLLLLVPLLIIAARTALLSVTLWDDPITMISKVTKYLLFAGLREAPQVVAAVVILWLSAPQPVRQRVELGAQPPPPPPLPPRAEAHAEAYGESFS